jgi:hypothetical protein
MAAVAAERRPPLARELFDPRGSFSAALDQYSELSAVVMRLRRAVHQGQQVEIVLKAIEDEAATFPAIHRQLLAVRCYLQQNLSTCGESWRSTAHGLTHYAELINEIERYRVSDGQPVIYVTFNYDTMLESDLSARYGTQFRTMESYSSPDYMLSSCTAVSTGVASSQCPGTSAATRTSTHRPSGRFV